MSEVETKSNIILEEDLFDQYNWFYKTFLPAIQVASDEFFSDLFSIHLISISKNINILFQGDDYFVTKIRIDKHHDAFFRCSSEAIRIILDKVLGENKKFDLSNITELEAKIISSYNDYLYNNISKFLLPTIKKDETNAKLSKTGGQRKNFDTIHLTLFIHDKSSNGAAKMIISLPQVLLNPAVNKPNNQIFDISDFKTSKIEANIKVGTTKFPLKEIKNLEKEDIVVFENSNIHTMELIYKGYKKDFKITPNPGLITSTNNNNGGNNMEENALSQSLWDNIQVEMGAEFEKVKISLGELKNIEQGLILDLTSVYDNKISLQVENKTIATGELVIINDRYGVRIDEVFATEKKEFGHSQKTAHPTIKEVEQASPPSQTPPEGTENSDEEFDYSDFELDDQDI